MTVRKRNRFRPQFEHLEGRLALAAIPITPPGFSDPSGGEIVQQIAPPGRPGLTTAQAHSGGMVLWSPADLPEGESGALDCAYGTSQFEQMLDQLAVASLTNATSSEPASAAPFSASGSITEVTFHGNHRMGPVEGSATFIGPFTGDIDARVTRLGNDETATGRLTLVGPEGDTLTLYFEIVRERGTAAFVGTYEVTGGTGRFADATGQGQMTLAPQPDLTADFTLDGSLAHSTDVESQQLSTASRRCTNYACPPWHRGTKGW